MPGTFTEILLHIVFSTKERQPWLTPDLADRLYPYIRGIVKAARGMIYEINGADDHTHIYLRWRPDKTISDLLRLIKANSSKWVHETFPQLPEFGWQEGYAAFTVSPSREKAVKKYIRGQAEHHRREDFKTELMRLLRAHGVEFDERYVFD